MLNPILRRLSVLFFAAGLAACALEATDAPLDAVDECATCSDKADEWAVPAEGSCDARGLVEIANEASFDELDQDAGLNRRAVEHMVEAREVAPFETVADVDAVRYVGVATLELILDYARGSGAVERCENEMPDPELEIGIISDLDKTVIPHAGDLALPDAPYPGVMTLYQILERGSDGSGAEGDTTYVTARNPERLDGVPEWLLEHGLPTGPIETGGDSSAPWVAQAEKVRDITRVLEARPGQSYVLFGDTSHRDPEVYREILATFPDRIAAGIIHMVNITVTMSRLEGLHLVTSYPEAAAVLFHLGVLTEDDARTVYEAAVDEGLELSESDFEAMLSATE
jgi:hypothetical protein